MAKSRTPDDQLTDLARAVRSMREETGLSVREFSDAAGFPRHTTYAYYEGPDFTSEEIRKGPRERIARALLAYGVPVSKVAQLGPLPKGVDPTRSAIDALQEQVAELREAVLGRRKAS